MLDSIFFLTEEEIISIHTVQINKYGGPHGIRDKGLLASAVHTPQATFSNQYLHQDIFQMAAAYMYSIIKNHPFIDDNKRNRNGYKTYFFRM